MPNPWDIQHPETPVATEGAKGRSYAVQMRRGQTLEVVTDAYGRFLSVNETMPPLIPSDRLPARTAEDERRIREWEWDQANRRIQTTQPTPVELCEYDTAHAGAFGVVKG